jgi:hypothetical protein
MSAFQGDQFQALREEGWCRIPAVVPKIVCDKLVQVLEEECNVPVHDPSRWGEYGGDMRDLIPIWGHQAQWDIRQLPAWHRIWAAVLGSERLCVSLDSCRFTPPWRPGYAQPLPIHWDHDPWDINTRMVQGVVALTDTASNQGGFCCMPSLFRDQDAWPKQPVVDLEGNACWLVDCSLGEIVHVPASAGDLIIWDSRLAHANSKNLSAAPRLAFSVMMGAASRDLRDANVESWCGGGRCVPSWRNRPGYDRVEPWLPAELTDLGRRLLGLDDWPT